MRVLVTGANGYLGGELMARLGALGFDAVGASRRAAPGLELCDLLDEAQTRALIARTAPDRILHAAAYVPQTLAEYADPETAARSLRMIELLLEASAEARTPVLYVSSMTVYGPQSEVLRREEDAGSPESPYGAGKWAGERLIRASGRDALAARIPGLFGGGRTGGLVGNTLRALQAGEAPSLPDRPLIWAAMDVRDAAQGIAEMMGLSFSGFVPVNFAYPGVYSIRRFVELASSVMGRPFAYDQAQPDFEFDLSRARSFGIATDRSLGEALERIGRELA